MWWLVKQSIIFIYSVLADKSAVHKDKHRLLLHIKRFLSHIYSIVWVMIILPVDAFTVKMLHSVKPWLISVCKPTILETYNLQNTADVWPWFLQIWVTINFIQKVFVSLLCSFSFGCEATFIRDYQIAEKSVWCLTVKCCVYHIAQ